MYCLQYIFIRLDIYEHHLHLRHLQSSFFVMVKAKNFRTMYKYSLRSFCIPRFQFLFSYRVYNIRIKLVYFHYVNITIVSFIEVPFYPNHFYFFHSSLRFSSLRLFSSLITLSYVSIFLVV